MYNYMDKQSCGKKYPKQTTLHKNGDETHNHYHTILQLFQSK